MKVLFARAEASLDSGQIREAVRYAQLYPAGRSGPTHGEDIGIADVIEEWGSVPEADLPAASMLAILLGLENKKKTEDTVNQALALVRHYPRSRYALNGLCAAIRQSRYDENVPQANRLKAVLARHYPESIPALCIKIEAAFNRGDLIRTRRLLANYRARKKDNDGEERYDQYPAVMGWIESRLSHYDQLVQQLKPLLDAAHDTDMARMDRIESQGESLAEALIKRLPDRAAEIYLTLGQVYHNPALTMRFLERFPSNPQAGAAWERLIGDDRMITPGALNGGGPETVEWLAPFVNRNDANSALTAALLEKTIASGNGEAGVRFAEEEARVVLGRYPRSRAACIADLGVAKALLNNRRPEATLAYADRAIAGLKKNDAMHPEAELVRQRAVQEIAAKHR